MVKATSAIIGTRWRNVVSSSIKSWEKDVMTNSPISYEVARQWCASQGISHAFSQLSVEEIMRAKFQKVGARQQLMDEYGEYVLTDPNQLPEGGHQGSHKITSSEVDLFICGDIGYPSKQQDAVFQHIGRSIDESANDALTLIVGDWMYPHGPSQDAPSDRDHFRKTVGKPLLQIDGKAPILGVLGNHEYGDGSGPADPKLFMEWVSDAGVSMPSRYYKSSLEGERWSADLFCLDTTSLICDLQQMEWLKEQIQESGQKAAESGTKRWKIIVAHHPLVSYGCHHGNLEFLRRLLGPELTGIDLYISGHEHDQEMNHAEGLPPTIVSGTGSESRARESFGQSSFLDTSSGYCRVKVNEESLSVDFISTQDSKPTLYHETIRA